MNTLHHSLKVKRSIHKQRSVGFLCHLKKFIKTLKVNQKRLMNMKTEHPAIQVFTANKHIVDAGVKLFTKSLQNQDVVLYDTISGLIFFRKTPTEIKVLQEYEKIALDLNCLVETLIDGEDYEFKKLIQPIIDNKK